MSRTCTLLVVEDGTEYTDAFRSLASNDPRVPVELVRAGDREGARRVLAERSVDAVFLDVVFDRTPPERLVGDLETQIRRFGGDQRRSGVADGTPISVVLESLLEWITSGDTRDAPL